jgi:uncharacterized membrane protein
MNNSVKLHLQTITQVLIGISIVVVVASIVVAIIHYIGLWIILTTPLFFMLAGVYYQIYKTNEREAKCKSGLSSSGYSQATSTWPRNPSDGK